MRVWTWFSFVSLWWSQNYGAGSWSTGAALINAGLTFNQALGVSALGCILTSLVGVAAAVSHSAQSRPTSWFSLIDAASGCGISYRFPSLVPKYIRNVGVKDNGRLQRSHCDHLVCCTNVSLGSITCAPRRPWPLNEIQLLRFAVVIGLVWSHIWKVVD